MLDMEKSWIMILHEIICEAGSMIQEEYINKCNCNFVNEEMGYLNRKGGRFLNKLYINNEEFREEIINLVQDKKRIRP